MASVLHFLLDVTELNDRQRDDDHHQNNRLRRGTAQVQTDEPIAVDLVDQNVRRARRAAAGRRMDDAECVEKGVNDIHHQQEERRRGQKRKDDRPETLAGAGAIDRRRLDQRARDRLKAGKEKQEVIADLFPRSRDHDQDHRIAAVQVVVPVIAKGRDEEGQNAD